MSETRKIAAILVARCGRLSAGIDGRGRGSHAVAAARAAQRSDRSRHRRASRAHRQAHRRRSARRVPQRGRRGALRDRSAERRWSSATPACRRERRIEFRIGIHLGDVVEESDGDLMGDGVNIAARLEGDRRARRDLPVRVRLIDQVEGRTRSGGNATSATTQLKNIARAGPGLLDRRSALAAAAEARAVTRVRERRRNSPRRTNLDARRCSSPGSRRS